jgi:hypothetical protein
VIFPAELTYISAVKPRACTHKHAFAQFRRNAADIYFNFSTFEAASDEGVEPVVPPAEPIVHAGDGAGAALLAMIIAKMLCSALCVCVFGYVGTCARMDNPATAAALPRPQISVFTLSVQVNRWSSLLIASFIF